MPFTEGVATPDESFQNIPLHFVVDLNDKQTVFNYVVNHLARQKRPARSEEGSCKYRLNISDGEKQEILSCAFGCLITDESYDVRIEYNTIELLLHRKWNPDFDPAAKDMLKSLQVSHDMVFKLERLRSDLYSIATTHELDASLVETITEWHT